MPFQRAYLHWGGVNGMLTVLERYLIPMVALVAALAGLVSRRSVGDRGSGTLFSGAVMG